MNFEERILLNELKLNDTDDQIIDYIRENIDKVVTQSIQKTAKEVFNVPNSIVRVAKKLGYNSFSEMKFELKREYNLESNFIHSNKELFTEINRKKSPIIREKINKLNCMSDNITKTLELIKEENIEKAIRKINESKSIKCLGIGDSIYFCEILAKELKCVGKHAEFFQHRHDMLYSAENCDTKDLYLAISVSGESNPVIEAVEKAKERGAYIISLTNFTENRLAKIADLKLFFWAPREYKNNYNVTNRVGIMILTRIISEMFWNNYIE